MSREKYFNNKKTMKIFVGSIKTHQSRSIPENFDADVIQT